jgi:ATP adenylyltransferase
MDRLWAPWRIEYIKIKKKKGCIFCKSIKSATKRGGFANSWGESKRKHYVVFKSRYSFVMLNIFPYNNGHLMICPLRHTGEISQLKDAEILDLFKALNNAKQMLDRALKPEGYNIGINISESAGAGITDHLHIHIVPRWKGDTNFMPVLYDAKVISQSLDELYKQLRKYIKYVKSKTD